MIVRIPILPREGFIQLFIQRVLLPLVLQGYGIAEIQYGNAEEKLGKMHIEESGSEYNTKNFWSNMQDSIDAAATES